MPQFKIALYQDSSAPTDLELNCWRVVSEAEKAISEGARLICFPEWFLSGLDWNRDYFVHSAIEGSHKMWLKLKDLCSIHQVAITVGGLEKYLRRYYSSIFAINEYGEQDVYRKQNKYWLEKNWNLGYGNQPIVFKALGMRIGLLSGSDLFAEETLSMYQYLKCDLFIVSSALVDLGSIKVRSGVFTLLSKAPQVLIPKMQTFNHLSAFLSERASLLKAPLLFCNQSGWMELPVPWLPIHLTFSWFGQSQLVPHLQPHDPVSVPTQNYRGWTYFNLSL